MSFNDKLGHMLGTYEAHAKLAEAWFTYLGFVAATAIFHAAAEKTNDTSLIVLKWACYFLLFGWVQFKINKLIWFLYPPADIENNKPSNIVLGFSVWLSSMIVFSSYYLSLYLFKVFSSAAA